MTKKRDIVVFILGCMSSFYFNEATSQVIRPLLKNYPKFLLIDICKIIKKDSCEITRADRSVPLILYDEKNAYYHYAFREEAKWQANQQYTFNVQTNLRSGFIYIFLVDAMNTPQFLKLLSLDTAQNSKSIDLPCSIRSHLLNRVGVEHLAIWFSNTLIEDYKTRIDGIEMTMGDFLSRNKRQLGGAFKELAGNWVFSKSHIGFYSSNNSKKNFVIPLLVDFKIKPHEL